LLSSCSSSVIWKVMDCRLHNCSAIVRERIGGAPHFREISCDNISSVSLMRNASSNAAENCKAIILVRYQRM
jgi:hypothetical protein